MYAEIYEYLPEDRDEGIVSDNEAFVTDGFDDFGYYLIQYNVLLTIIREVCSLCNRSICL